MNNIPFDITKEVQAEHFSFQHYQEKSFCIDWTQIDTSVTLEIPANHHVQLMELGDPKKKAHYVLKENASLSLSIASLEDAMDSERSFQLEEQSRAEVAYADFCAGEKKAKLYYALRGKQAYVRSHVASLSAQEDKKEFDVSFDHFIGDTYAEMQNFGVCEGKSTLTFSGVGFIHHGAKRAATHQNAKIMVFDPKCRAFANPVLKIDENEVEASHAAAVGKVNDEHLFYLTSRGLNEEEAKQLITLGYLKPIFSYFKDEEMIQKISDSMERRMK